MGKLLELFSTSDRHCELTLILYMTHESSFLDLNPLAFYSTDTREAYKEITSQYYSTGVIEINALSEAVRSLVFECDLHYPKSIGQVVERLNNLLSVRLMANKVATTFSDLSEKNISEKLPSLTKDLSDLIIQKGSSYNHGKSVLGFIDYLREQKESGFQMRGISSEIDKLDQYISGFQKGKFYVIGGMEKMGKSRFCAYLTSVWARKNIGGIWFSLEMQEDDIHECILSHRATVDSMTIGSPNITEAEIDRINQISQSYMNEPLLIDTTSATTPEYIREVIKSQKIKWAKSGHNVVYVIVDYIQRMVYGSNRAGELEDVAKKLADIARDENVVMIAISQLSQEAERDANAASNPYRFIKGSKGIREAADCTIVLFKPQGTYESETAKEIHAYIVQRKGISNIAIKMLAQLQYTSFKDHA